VIYFYNCFCALPEQSLLGRSSAELTTIFYCLIWDSPNLEGQVPVFISPRVAQSYPWALGSLLSPLTTRRATVEVQNRVFRTIGNFPRGTSIRDMHVAFQVPYVYDYITKLCRRQAETIHNHENITRLNLVVVTCTTVLAAMAARTTVCRA
jgi:hypothetical protein